MSSRFPSKDLKIKICKIIMLSVVLCGCNAWSLTLREERRLRVFENKIMRRIFRPKGDAIGEWKMLNNIELHSFTVHVILSERLSLED